jgi:TolB-like protein/DNA-binding winged helix-turn-helix (wHTH) protein
MLQPHQTRCEVSFGPFTVDFRSAELKKHGVRVKIQDRPFEILTILLERPGEVVTRDELRNRLWPEGTFVDFDNNISASVGKLRGTLSDSAAMPRYVETVGRGYRFIAQVTRVPATLEGPKPTLGPQAAAQRRPAQVSAPRIMQASPPRAHRIWIPVAGAVTLLTLAGFLVYSLLSRTPSRRTSGKVMLAVLPFSNLTGDATQEYFSDGLTEEMITQLGRLETQRIGVIARTSVMSYKNTSQPLPRIAQELGVQYVLEGSVRRYAQRIRIAAQLIGAQDQSHLWAREYDRQLSDVLTLQSEIAETIAGEIQIALGTNWQRPAVARSGPLSPQSYKAYDLYLQGRYYWNKRTPGGFRKALELFQQATENDPGYARAYAGLADSYAMMSNYGFAAANDCMPKARAAALKALQSDDSLAEAHTSLAVIAQDYDWDWQTAEKEYRRAIELNANYATAHHWYAEYLAYQGRFDEALAESERARELDPLSLIIAADNGAIFYFSRQYDRAIERFRAVLNMDPGFARAHLVIVAYAQKGQFAAALADIDAWRHTAGDQPWIVGWEAYVYGRAGQHAKARQALQKVEDLSRKWQADPTQFMIVSYSGIGDKENCLTWLEKAIRERTNVPTGLKVDPLYDPLRSDPRFQALLRRVGLAQ